MKIALLYPIVAALVEKMASVFPEGITVIGPPCDDLYKWDSRILPLAKANDRIKEWADVGLKVDFIEAPYSECDFSKFDCLIEPAETFHYAKDWANHCERVECPIVVKVCWVNDPTRDFPERYVARKKKFPLLMEMPSHYEAWKASAFEDVSLVLEPVGDWWFEKSWTGEREEILFTLAGSKLWRPVDDPCGLSIWDEIVKRFPGRARHQDGALDFKTAREMSELYSGSRCYVNLDRGDARPLSVAFIEALCAGLPVAARDYPGISYAKFIDGNGAATNDLDAMCAFFERCLSDRSYASELSDRSREIGHANFSTEVLRPQYLAAVERAKKAFLS